MTSVFLRFPQQTPQDQGNNQQVRVKHRRFKYFSKPEYAEAFLVRRLFCQTAAFFRDHEDALRVEYEGRSRLFRGRTSGGCEQSA